ncbi:MAG TPA: PEP-utilizing enzyme [Candidatus Saccharimonadales bacterium]|nr:PEP-utilizing enzyme [Candidatus Saccharimonadales bacterium]
MVKFSLLNQDINTSFFNIETTWTGMRSPILKKQIGLNVPDSFCELIKGETLNYFQNQRQAKQFSKTCAKHIISDKKLLLAIKKKTEKLSCNSLKLARHFFPLPKLSDEEIIILLKDIRKVQKELAAWGMIVAFADVYGEIANQITSIFTKRKNLRYPMNVYLDILSNPVKPSLTTSAYFDILNSKDDKKLLQKYFWLDQGYIGRGLILKQLKEIRRHQKNNVSHHNLERNSLLLELNLNKEEQNLLQIAAEMVYLKSLRSDTRQALYVISNKIIDNLAVCWHILPKYLEAMSTLEIIAAIKDAKKIPLNLKQRWLRSLIIPTSLNNYKIISDNSIDDFLDSRLDISIKEKEELKELTGQIAQPGKVRGRVKLVFGYQHNAKVKKGDILVAVSTSPQLLPAMKLAAAFVTDMGGITSHAAIVARELKVPCIVGMKVATKILQDGDLVEVDAEKGIVRIIKRK